MDETKWMVLKIKHGADDMGGGLSRHVAKEGAVMVMVK